MNMDDIDDKLSKFIDDCEEIAGIIYRTFTKNYINIGLDRETIIKSFFRYMSFISEYALLMIINDEWSGTPYRIKNLYRKQMEEKWK
jgi:hypothetical protein